MGRPEKPIERTGVLADFASQLRQLRAYAGTPTYRDMGRWTGRAPSTLSEAATGVAVPSWPVVASYVTACGADLDDWRDRWGQLVHAPPPAPAEGRLPARQRTRPTSPPTPTVLDRFEPPPLPVDAHDSTDFVRCMRKLKVWAGDPSLRAVERRSGGLLRRATLSGLLRGDQLPTWDVLDAFLAVCGVRQDDHLREWAHAWRRIRFVEREEHLREPLPGPPRLRAVSGT